MNKEEAMEEREDLVITNIKNKQLKVHSLRADKTQLIINDDYELIQEDDAYYIVRKQTKYPKTYEECCKIVNASPYVKLVYDISDGQKYSYDVDNLQLHENIRRLKICRDAYLKIAGDWEEERKEKAIHYVIYSTLFGSVIKDMAINCITNYFLDFPTKEMRDAFYDNFKDLIKQCNKLLYI